MFCWFFLPPPPTPNSCVRLFCNAGCRWGTVSILFGLRIVELGVYVFTFSFFFPLHRVPAILNRESAETQSKQTATERHWNPLRSRLSAPGPSRRQEHLLHGTINQCLKANTLCITEKQIKGPKYVSGVVCFCVVPRASILMFISSRTLSVQVSKCCIYR